MLFILYLFTYIPVLWLLAQSRTTPGVIMLWLFSVHMVILAHIKILQFAFKYTLQFETFKTVGRGNMKPNNSNQTSILLAHQHIYSNQRPHKLHHKKSKFFSFTFFSHVVRPSPFLWIPNFSCVIPVYKIYTLEHNRNQKIMRISNINIVVV